MKKLVLSLMACAAVLASCDGLGGSKSRLQAENDSLQAVLNERNAELDEMMGTFNDISEGFRQINAAENRVDLQRGALTEGSLSAKQQIASDIEFIRKQMEENKQQIAKLQEQLKNSRTNSAQLKRAVETLTQELVEKTKRIEELQAELASKNIRIQELDAAVTTLTTEKETLTAENEAKAQTVAAQDKALNAAWFVFGTKKELKDQRILTNTGVFKKGDVMQDANMNKDYFTQIDIRYAGEGRQEPADAENHQPGEILERVKVSGNTSEVNVPTRYRSLFFDLDDTLWAFSENAEDTFRAMYDKYGYGRFFRSFGHFYALYTERNLQLWEEYGQGRITKDELNRIRFLHPLQQVGVEDAGLAQAFADDFFAVIPTCKKLMPHAREVLDYLSGRYRLYILSNGFRELQYRKMCSAGIEGYFRRVVLSEDIGLLKPRKELFDFALSATQSEARDSLMIGDNWENDIAGARHAGWHQVYYAPAVEASPLPFRPTYFIRDLRELTTFL